MLRFLWKKWHRFTDFEPQQSEPVAIINESTTTTTTTTTATTKLTDINDDCLEHIFLYLSIEDLVNIAYTSKTLKPAAELAFSRNFGTKRMDIGESPNGNTFMYEYRVRLCPDQFYRLMSSFGHLILKIELGNFKPNLLNVVNQFCCKSITDLKFAGMNLQRMKKSFHAAETVSLVNVNTNWLCNPLNKLFPNVRKLHILEGHIWSMKTIGLFPHLNQLTVSCSWARSNANIMRMNPQVQNLVLCGRRKCAKYVRYASKHLKVLERLEITTYDLNDFDNSAKDVKFKFLKELKIILRSHLYIETMKIPICSRSLNEFTFHLSVTPGDKNREDNLNILIDFFKKCPSLTKVTLSRWMNIVMPINNEILIKIADALLSIETINISMLKISFSDAIEFVKYCKRLKKLCFVIKDIAGFDRLQESLAPEWHAVSVKLCCDVPEYDTHHITIVKRQHHTSIDFIERNANGTLRMCSCDYNII